MLRSANKINISAKTIQNYDGLIISPKINFLGLIITCDTEIDDRIKSFFKAHGGAISVEKIDDEFLVKLTGEFNITNFEVEAFLKTNPDLIVDDLSESNNLNTCPSMKRSIRETIDHCKSQPRPLQFTNGEQNLELTRGLLDTNSSEFKIGVDINFGGVVISGEEHVPNVVLFSARRAININGMNFKTQQSQVGDEIQIGLLGDVHSIDTLKLSAGRNLDITDAIVDAANVLDINASPNGNVRLNLQKDIEWLNNPYPEDYKRFIRHETGAFKTVQMQTTQAKPGLR